MTLFSRNFTGVEGAAAEREPDLYEVELTTLVERFEELKILPSTVAETVGNHTSARKASVGNLRGEAKGKKPPSHPGKEPTLAGNDPPKDYDPIRDYGSSIPKERCFLNHMSDTSEGGRNYQGRMDICPNPQCTSHRETTKGNIVFNGSYQTKGKTNVRRFLCKTCGKVFCSREGSLFYGLRSSEEKVLTALKLLLQGMPLRKVATHLGVKLDTIRHWLQVVSEQKGIDDMLRKRLRVSQVELDALWGFVKSKNLRQRATQWKPAGSSGTS